MKFKSRQLIITDRLTMRNHSGCDQVGMSFQRLLGLLVMALGLWACTPTEVAKVEPELMSCRAMLFPSLGR